MERTAFPFPAPTIWKPKAADAKWQFVVETLTLTLLDENGETAAKWSGPAVLAAVKVPSFSETNDGYRFALGNQWVPLAIDFQAEAALRDLLERVTIISNPDTPKKAVQRGLLLVVVGVVVLTGSGAYMAYRAKVVAQQGNGYVAGMGGLVAGFGMFCKGILDVLSYGRWKRLRKEMDEEQRRNAQESQGGT